MANDGGSGANGALQAVVTLLLVVLVLVALYFGGVISGRKASAPTEANVNAATSK